MAFIPFINVAEVVFKGTLAGQQCYLTFGIRKGSAIGGTDLSDIADVFDAWWATDFRAELSTNYNAGSIKVTDLSSDSAPTFEKPVTAPTDGAVASASVPNNVAMVVSFLTANRGRSYRGRNYVMGVPSADLDTNTSFESSSCAAVQLDYEQLQLALAGAGFEHVVLSRFNAGAERAVGVSTAVETYRANTPVGTQRRRVTGHGI